eukprot:2359605-Alexandrium_andersonii.AAC.1
MVAEASNRDKAREELLSKISELQRRTASAASQKANVEDLRQQVKDRSSDDAETLEQLDAALGDLGEWQA